MQYTVNKSNRFNAAVQDDAAAVSRKRRQQWQHLLEHYNEYASVPAPTIVPVPLMPAYSYLVGEDNLCCAHIRSSSLELCSLTSNPTLGIASSLTGILSCSDYNAHIVQEAQLLLTRRRRIAAIKSCRQARLFWCFKPLIVFLHVRHQRDTNTRTHTGLYKSQYLSYLV